MHLHTEYSILKVLAYYDLFRHPVCKQEILFFLDQPVKEAELDKILARLTAAQCLFRIGEFYSLHNDPSLAAKRMKNNAQAKQLLKTAQRIAGLLFRFPYVRGVGISGSLSKNCADETADIDFFIITRANRLWIARTLLGLFRKIAILAGKGHWFCFNYFIDEAALQIEEQNIFTATELITLLPAYGNGTLDNFLAANDWVVKYYPNYLVKISNNKSTYKKSVIKNLVEYIFNNRMGDKLDHFLMKSLIGRWKRIKQDQQINKRGFRMEIKSSRHFLKPNPGLFQQKVITSFNEKLKEFETKWKNALDKPMSVTPPFHPSNATC